MKNEEDSMLKLTQDELGIKPFRFISYPHATIKLHFS